MKSKLLLSVLVVSTAATAGGSSRATAKQDGPASDKFSVIPVIKTTETAKAALRKAPELIVGSDVQDVAGCLYTVGSKGSNLVLIPVFVDGKRICATSK